ncbi:ATP-binding response regulator [Chitinimonas koreensis]|uniref:ATP-binding response regulator n=1 Tax=Chitinimonas koreensis TaxID=356302 RepID=UPI000427D8FB|nr:hybrid sensor histidine kinase/response regulator [Chitinimonas koreensis]QNM95363.1 response regulator [Chitinimonas koreensis]
MRRLFALAFVLLAALHAAAQPLVLRQARFWPSHCDARQGQGDLVALPDLWSARGVQGPGASCYRFDFALEQAPAGNWALELRRISRDHTIWLNGHLLSNRGSPHSTAPTRLGSMARLAEIPPALWRDGDNRIELEVSTGQWPRAGLAEPHVGPDEVLRPQFELQRYYERSLPQAINLTTGLLAVLTLLIWAWRPRERALAYFSVLFLLGSVRNWYYYADLPLVSASFGNWFFYAAQVWTATLLLLFSAELCGRRNRRRDLALVAAASLLCTLSAMVGDSAWLERLRAVTYPVLIATLPTTLWWLYRGARAAGPRVFAGVMAGLAVVLIGAAHDYLVVNDLLGLEANYWLPFSIPLVLAAFAVYQLRRMVSALGEVEELADLLEYRVRERTHALELANTAKTRFLASASHDLRQPMHAISILVATLDQRMPRIELGHVVDQLKHGVQAMEELLKGILDLSRLDAGGVHARPTEFALGPLLDAIERSEAAHARERGLALRVRPSRDWVRSDPIMLERILRNLVGNALRYTERGGVLVGCRRRGERLRIEIWDSGIGIDAEQLPRVFEEFYQVGNAARDRSKGLGLGLSIVEQYARLLGHRIEVRSRPGRGSCFAIEVPGVEAALPAAERAVPGLAALSGAFVLVVEDDAGVREATALLLRSWGCHVEVADGADAAVEALDLHLRWPDLLLVDHRLGGETSGRQVIELLRLTIGEAVPAILVTGDVAPEVLRELSDSGLPVLHKPINALQLRGAMADALAVETMPAA